MSLRRDVDRIAEQLSIGKAGVAETLRKANQMMGWASTAPLPEQAAKLLAALDEPQNSTTSSSHRSTTERHQRVVRGPISALVVERQELICALRRAGLRNALHAAELRDGHQPPAEQPQHCQMSQGAQRPLPDRALLQRASASERAESILS